MAKTAYSTPIGEYDVQDKSNLHKFRDKRDEWLEWLIGDDEHAIYRQIGNMCWSYIVYRLINKAVGITTERNKSVAVRNYGLFEFATLGYVTTQSLFIRRLEEKEAPVRNRERQVISLRRLVEDICRHQNLFTREMFVGYDGAPYDPDPARQRYWQQLFARPEVTDARGVVTWSEPYLRAGPDAWRHAERSHEIFDRLAYVNPTQRKRSDYVNNKVFCKLQKLIDEPVIEKVRHLANKRITHSADAFSRSKADYQLNGISFNDVDNVHRALITAAGFIASTLLCETNLAPVPRPQSNMFEHLETSGLDEQDFTRLRRLANALAERRERWAQSGLQDLAQ